MGQAELETDGINVYVIYDGKRIAERGWTCRDVCF
jgi:hypothetical protein